MPLCEKKELQTIDETGCSKVSLADVHCVFAPTGLATHRLGNCEYAGFSSVSSALRAEREEA
ncbi:MAG: hypothetical protein ACRC46_09255, partial [Thermoguttaceae bacterium]